MEQEKTLIITTGGTIDAQYDPAQGTPYQVPLPSDAQDSGVPGALRHMGLADRCDFLHYSMKDSKGMGPGDMDALMGLMAEHPHRRVIIVHGTDTMPTNAQYMQHHLHRYDGWMHPVSNRQILFTGAMGPLRDGSGQFRLPESTGLLNDGWVNLRHAIERIDQVAPGEVAIEMGKADRPLHASALYKEVIVDRPGHPQAKVIASEMKIREATPLMARKIERLD